MFALKNKVWILNSRKIDGRYNKGVIVGIELICDSLNFVIARKHYFTAIERQYFNNFEEHLYKVAYVDIVTGNACCEWVHHTDLAKTKPKPAQD